MAEVWALLGYGWLGAGLLMIALWLIQRHTRNAGIVDVGWAAITGTLAVWHALGADGVFVRRVVVGFLGAGWGWRLAWHLLRDRVWGQPEEGRYVTLRRNWSPHADRAFFIFFQAQAAAAVALSLPFALAAVSARPFPVASDIAGMVLVIVGVVGETVADRQLLAFKRDPSRRGQTCRTGLWRYSRHPNYFFEWILWCGFGVFGLAGPWGWLGLVAPLIMLMTILFVTGIPPTEAQALASRGEDYRRYQQTTSAFIPWRPRRLPERPAPGAGSRGCDREGS
jgi:steroid 5-alpha reductase family enzyme